MKNINTELLIEKIEGICLTDSNADLDIKNLEMEFNCDIQHNVEKHNVLQHTYYYEIDFGVDQNFFIEMENGIQNGSQINSAEWGYSTFENTKIIEVLDDVVFNEDKFNAWYSGDEKNKPFVKTKAVAIFNNHKEKLLQLHKGQTYDDYVTGGGTNKTDSHYSNEYNKLREINVFWEYTYKEVEVYRNMI